MLHPSFLLTPAAMGLFFAIGILSVTLSACNEDPDARKVGALSQSAEPPSESGFALILGPTPGDDRVDRDIRRQQDAVRNAPWAEGALEALGWLFVSKARQSSDPGYYLHAEQCAALMESRNPGHPDALLLRGHAYQNRHEFAQAAALAEDLVRRRGSPYDFGLRGDALLELGDLEGALTAYQSMLDMKPGFQSYGRAAHLRWLTGDLDGALELMEMAVRAGSPRDADAMAWAHARLAVYRLQKGRFAHAHQSADRALAYRPGHPAALAARGRIFLAEGKSAAAAEALEKAVRGDALPEYQWALLEALSSLGRTAQGEEVFSAMLGRGEARDPRTLAVFLATRSALDDGRAKPSPSGGAGRAMHLALKERTRRGDVFTHDALAWSHHAAGNAAAAFAHADSALAAGTRDARLSLHAGIISLSSGRHAEARARLRAADAEAHMLLPSERKALREARRAADAAVARLRPPADGLAGTGP